MRVFGSGNPMVFTRPDHKAVLIYFWGSLCLGGRWTIAIIITGVMNFTSLRLSTVLKKRYDASIVKLQFFFSSSSVPAKSPG